MTIFPLPSNLLRYSPTLHSGIIIVLHFPCKLALVFKIFLKWYLLARKNASVARLGVTANEEITAH